MLRPEPVLSWKARTPGPDEPSDPGVPRILRSSARAIHRESAGTTTIYTARRSVTVRDETGQLARVVNSLTGRHTADELQNLGAFGPLPNASMEALLSDLYSDGIVAAPWLAWMEQHSLECNPQPHPGALTSETVHEFTAGRHVARDWYPESDVGRAIAERSSCRSFDPLYDLDIGRLQSLLRTASVAAAPSAGALNPVTASIIHRHDGIYTHHWLSGQQTAHRVNEHDLRYALNSADLLHGAAAIAVLWADPTIAAAKYSNRGYRFTLLEVGHIAQNLLLLTAEAQLGSLEWGAYKDQTLIRVLHPLDGLLPFTCVGIGRPAADAGEVSLERKVRINTSESVPSSLKDPVWNGVEAGFVIAQHQRAGRVVGTGVGWSSDEAILRCQGEVRERDAFMTPRWDLAGPERSIPVPPIAVTTMWPPTMPIFDSTDCEPYSPRRAYQWVLGSDGSGSAVAAPIDALYAFQRPRRCALPNSSGTAFHFSEKEARRSALFELIERDAFVRAWVSQRPPLRLSTELIARWPRVGEIQASGCRIDILAFQACQPTIGVRIRRATWPALAFGLATKDSWEEALEKAYIDALAHFVLSHNLSRRHCEDEPRTPLDHHMYYLDPEHASDIDTFFEGQVGEPWPSDSETYRSLFEGTGFFVLDRTPPGFVVRAVNPSLRAIWFGKASQPSDAPPGLHHFLS